ncbi:MAG: DNA-directed RNA polymerase subunit RpoH/Rpb5 C-terminal domain-containing protein [Candidatus Micrarchaeota archaeon]
MTKKAENLPHYLRPEHVIISDEEKKKVLEKFNISEAQLPKIKRADPALVGLEATAGDLVRIKRKDLSGDYEYYRRVVEN